MAAPDPLLVLPVVLSALWILFLLLYASRLIAVVVKLVANLFLKESGIHIGWWLRVITLSPMLTRSFFL